MLAVVFDKIEESIQEILMTNIKNKYPSISFKVYDRSTLLSESSPETIIVVINEENANDGYIKLIKGAYPTLEHLICLAYPENFDEYNRLYGKVCKVIKQTTQGIQDWFNSIEGEPKPIKQIDDFAVSDEIGIDLEELLSAEAVDTDISQTDMDEISLELENASLEQSSEELFESMAISSDKDAEDSELSISISVEEYPDISDETGLEVNMPDISEVEDPPKVQETVLTDNDKSDKVKKMLEEKIIALREDLDIPVWQKKQIHSKTIGLWSPLQRIGTTTLTMNLAMYLASLSVPISVLEGITKNIKMKTLLEVYSKKKKNWLSYNSYLDEPGRKAAEAVWPYRNVNYFPLEEHDIATRWTDQKIYYYMNGLKFHDLVLVDLPSGEMAPYTLESLKYMDELWVIVNNDLLSMIEWKEYIHNSVGPYVDLRSIFIDELPFSKPKKIAEQLGLKLITSIPSVHDDIVLNYFESFPLIEHEGVLEKVEPKFIEVLEHLTGEQIKKSLIKDHQEAGFINRLAKKMKIR